MERRLLDATERLMSEGASFTELSVDRLSTEAGISRASFYIYFEDKAHLLRRLARQVMSDLADGGQRWWGVAWRHDPDDVRAAMDLIHADVLAIHLNFLQEMVQPEGDRRSKGCLERIGELAARFPVLVKETGAGISREVAEELRARSVKAFDVSGTGGTSFAAVEYYRAVEQGAEREARVGKTFWNWGIPSPISVLELVPLGIPVVASGGVRSGLDVARALALGATAAGTAGGMLRAAATDYLATRKELEFLVHELKVAMFLTGSRTVADLQKSPYLLTGESRLWRRR